MKNVFGLPNKDGVSRIIAALTPDNDIGVLRQDVNNLAFTLVAPLGAY